MRMTGINISRFSGYAAAFISLAAGIYGLLLLFIKPDLPFQYDSIDNFVVATENYSPTIIEGDRIREINGKKINTPEMVEFISDGMNIGENVSLLILSGDTEKTINLELGKAYKDNSFIIISGITGLAFWILAVFVFVKKRGGLSATVLFIMVIFFSIAIMTSPGKHTGFLIAPSVILKMLHIFAYAGGISCLIHFSLVFPQRIYGGKYLVLFNYILFFSFGALMNFIQAKAIISEGIEYAELFHMLWTVLLLFLLAGIIWSVINFFISFFRHGEDTERRKVQWALWGLLSGVAPYIILWVVPNLLDVNIPVREEYSLAFLIFIPFSFVIGVLRYKLFDIELIFSKSLVYFSLSVLIAGLYFLIVYLFDFLFSSLSESFIPVHSFVAAILIAVLFNPLRTKIQNIVDKYFYRIQYDFRITVRKFNESLFDCDTLEQLGKKILEGINEIIPVKKSAIVSGAETGKNFRVLAENNFEELYRTNSGIYEILFKPEEIKADVSEESGKAEFILKVPLMLNSETCSGLILLGEKLSGIVFTGQDKELLKTISGNCASVINRIELRERIIISEIEKKRFEDLSNMKSDFVSSVSHELKTPLTSIRLFAETLMANKEIEKEKQKEYAEIIYGESERLTRLINNILDFSKIERGIKKYNFETVCLNKLLEYVLGTMEYQFKKNNAALVKRISPQKIFVNADSDAIAEVVINLLSNALKYSTERPWIEVSLKAENFNAIIGVKDNGIGIEKEELTRIFDKFYRADTEKGKHTGGAGIGLSIVKSIMDSHNGGITVKSLPGEGSTFSLILKILEI
jgi:signal transduction histidine kinase